MPPWPDKGSLKNKFAGSDKSLAIFGFFLNNRLDGKEGRKSILVSQGEKEAEYAAPGGIAV